MIARSANACACLPPAVSPLRRFAHCYRRCHSSARTGSPDCGGARSVEGFAPGFFILRPRSRNALTEPEKSCKRPSATTPYHGGSRSDKNIHLCGGSAPTSSPRDRWYATKREIRRPETLNKGRGGKHRVRRTWPGGMSGRTGRRQELHSGSRRPALRQKPSHDPLE